MAYTRSTVSMQKKRTFPVQTRSLLELRGLKRSTEQQATTARESLAGPAFDISGIAIQPKLSISHPGDKDENEADRVADDVMRIPDRVTRGAGANRAVSPVLLSPADTKIQTKAQDATSPSLFAENFSRDVNLNDGGKPMASSVRTFMEPRFRRDFHSVRIHTGADAANSARNLNARAFTVGRHIAFAAGQYQPSTSYGKRLLAHELAHTIQQSGRSRPLIQRARLRDYSDASKDEYDPSRLSDAKIEATNEFKAYMNQKLVWQKKDKVTKEEALLACRLLLRAIREKKSVDWETGGRIYLNKARKQLGVVQAIEPFVGTIPWEQQAVSLLGTDFGKWLLAGGSAPNSSTYTMNCWEVVFFGAYEKGYVSKKWLKGFYKNFTANLKSKQAAGGDVLTDKSIENKLRASAEYTFDPADPDTKSPLAGDIVIFKTAVTHTAISLGTKTGGKHDVISLWNKPGTKLLQKTTIEDLLAVGASKPVKFWSPGWK